MMKVLLFKGTDVLAHDKVEPEMIRVVVTGSRCFDITIGTDGALVIKKHYPGHNGPMSIRPVEDCHIEIT